MGQGEGRAEPIEKNERHIGTLSSWSVPLYPLPHSHPLAPFPPPGFFFWQAIGGGLMTVAPALTYSLKASLRLLLPCPRPASWLPVCWLAACLPNLRQGDR